MVSLVAPGASVNRTDPRDGPVSDTVWRMRQAVVYGLVGGVLIALLKLIEYKYLVRAYPGEVYGGLVALIFTAIGIHVGMRWTRNREKVVIREVLVPAGA